MEIVAGKREFSTLGTALAQPVVVGNYPRVHADSRRLGTVISEEAAAIKARYPN
ncbi:hypothetical protein [Pseudomonas typographi]|uniref:hypothetical protein n=1 Tax=Pseudomonas typographi TaxID=2715964 RepID=UPI0016851C6E|nr:hypothetical protein [Pseudomonas typographi]MBD1551739.1 hypothetical protein [Pseudomonas typographi]MBD1587006.1 hypothetical protein [Pseudomonas typographi]